MSDKNNKEHNEGQQIDDYQSKEEEEGKETTGEKNKFEEAMDGTKEKIEGAIKNDVEDTDEATEKGQKSPEDWNNLDHLFVGRTRGAQPDLTIGAPGPDILATLPPVFAAATEHRLSHEECHGNLFQYGPELGHTHYRRQLSAFLSRHYQDPVHVESLVLTCGATHGLHLTTSLLVRPGGVVFLESQTYFMALKIFVNDLNMKLVPVNMTEDGVDTDHLEQMVAKEKTLVKEEGERFWGMLYTIPVFHNPTGVTMSQAVREKVVQIARRHDLLVVCDDVYNLLNYEDGPPPARLLAVDREMIEDYKGNVISCGTFSKILCPGVRVGWLEVPARLVDKFGSSGVFLSSGSMNNYVAGVVSSLLELGLVDTHLTRLREILKARMDAVCSTLQQELPPSCSVVKPGGGYFVWVKREDGDMEEFCSWLERNDSVTILRGARTSPTAFLGQEGDTSSHCVRISIAFYQLDTLVQAVKLMVGQLKAFISGQC